MNENPTLEKKISNLYLQYLENKLSISMERNNKTGEQKSMEISNCVKKQ